MGYGGSFREFDPADREHSVRLYHERMETLVTEMSDPPKWVISAHESLGRSVEWLDDLNPPPETNKDLDKAFNALKDWHVFVVPPEQGIGIWNWRSRAIIDVTIPEFIGERSNRGEILWRRLTAKDEVYELTLDSGRYRLELGPDRCAGYLSFEESQELATELRAVLPDIQDLYTEVDEEYDSFVPARDMHLVECVHALCVNSLGGIKYQFTA